MDSDNQGPLDNSPASDTIMAGRNIPMPALTHATDHGHGPVPSLRGPLATRSTCGPEINIPEGIVRTTSAEGSSGEGLRRDAQNTSQTTARE